MNVIVIVMPNALLVTAITINVVVTGLAWRERRRLRRIALELLRHL